jgi:uncharacterized OB-fold protein
MAWVEMQGKGKLSAFTCIAVGPPAMLAEGYNRERPYCSGVVSLNEGVRIVARIEGIDPRKPEEIRVGAPVTAKFVHRDQGERMTTYLVFQPI